MGARTGRVLPAQLEAGRERFEHWRSECAPRTRIPEPLWQLASELAGEFGVHRTAKALRLNYDALKARLVVGQAQSSSAPVTFVEMTPGSVTGTGQCSVEFDDGRGAQMRVHLGVGDVALLGALVEVFLRGGR